jgi:hypothetical protein
MAHTKELIVLNFYLHRLHLVMSIFKSINIVEILRLGLSGLMFLFAVLAFELISREQQRSEIPRAEILKAIYVFIVTNLISSALVGVSQYFFGRGREKSPSEISSDSYLVDYTSYLVDLTKWSETTLGPIAIIRTDYVTKVGSTNEDYIIPYFTTGEAIECKPITASSRPRLEGKKDPDRKGMHYDYILPIGHQPVGYSEMVSSQFTYPSGFKDREKEWWQASVAYPTRTISVVFRFPNEKLCKDMQVARIQGIKGKQPITDNLPIRSEGGLIVIWVGLNHPGNSRIQFDWEW